MKRKVQGFWVGIAALLTFMYWSATLDRPLALEPHAFARAHMGVLARSFAQLGILHLHAVPLENNPPIGTQPDVYVHWPTLYPILLSAAFRMFGESAAVIHAFAILVNILYLGAFYALVRRCFDKSVAGFSLFALLTIPIFIKYGTFSWTPNAAMAAVTIALYCFVRGTETNLNWKWISAGSIALVLGVLTSWEVALLGPVLLGIAVIKRSRAYRVAAMMYAAAGLGAAAIMLLLLVSSSFELQRNLWGTALHYMGRAHQSADNSINDLADPNSPRMSLIVWATIMRSTWVPLLGGAIGQLATMGLLIWTWYNRKTRPEVLCTVGGLLGLVVLWTAVFPAHVSIHEYEALIAAPLFSIGLGFTMKVGEEHLSGAYRWLAVLILPSFLLVPLVKQAASAFLGLITIDSRNPPELENMEYAKDIESSTRPSSVILSPTLSMVPVYYSHRHIVRGVMNDEVLRVAIRQTGAVFPGSDVYLAIRPDSLPQFSCASSRFPLAKRTTNMILLKVIRGACE